MLLTLNLFKDKLTCTAPWAVEDVGRVVKAHGFDPATFVDRLRHAAIGGPAWVVAEWMGRTRDSAAWREIRRLLGGEAPPRRFYTSLIALLFSHASPTSLPVRLLTRMASDTPARWAPALALSAAWEVESRFDLRRRRRPR